MSKAFQLFMIMWLSFSTDNDDDLYGVLSSIRRMEECKKITLDKSFEV